MTDLTSMSATEMARAIREKRVSSVELVEAHLRRIERVNPKINALVTMTPDPLEKARAADQAVAAGRRLGPLHGVPFTVKDCIDTAGIRTTWGTLLLKDNVPSADATAVARLKRAGGVMLGKTNLPEFALDAETNNRVFGRTVNPWDTTKAAGGSSGGEGAALASNMSPLGVGSDVGGSIRIPASFCGVVGLKATHGRIPLTGHWPSTRLRAMHVGPMARRVEDIALALGVLSGPDGVDPYSMPVPRRRTAEPGRLLPKLRVGWTAEKGIGPVAKDVQKVVIRAAAYLGEMGCRVEEVSLPWLEDYDYLAMHLKIFTAEVMAYARPMVKGRESDLAQSTLYFLNAEVPSFQQYLNDRDAAERLRSSTAAFFRKYDIFLAPTVGLPAFPHDEPEHVVGGEKVPKYQVTRNTSLWNYTGSPALSVPFGWTPGGLPVGVQLVGQHFREDVVLAVGAALESGAARRKPRV